MLVPKKASPILLALTLTPDGAVEFVGLWKAPIWISITPRVWLSAVDAVKVELAPMEIVPLSVSLFSNTRLPSVTDIVVPGLTVSCPPPVAIRVLDESAIMVAEPLLDVMFPRVTPASPATFSVKAVQAVPVTVPVIAC